MILGTGMTEDVRYDRLILLMDDDELEQFCRAWTEKKSGYHEVKRFAGPGRHGSRCRRLPDRSAPRRAVGQLPVQAVPDRGQPLAGPARNRQRSSTGPRRVSSHHRHFYFVAPKGLARKLEVLIDKPAELKAALIDDWDTVCANAITKQGDGPARCEGQGGDRCLRFRERAHHRDRRHDERCRGETVAHRKVRR